MFKVSIIIPVFNAVKYIETAIISALSPVGTPVEVVVVDDGSTDHSLDVAQAFGDRIRIISQLNQGACVARNAGMRAAKGKYIKFLDADDYLLPGALKAQVEHAEGLGSSDFSYGRVMRHIEVDGRLIPHSARDNKPDNRDTFVNLLRDPPVTSAMLYPSEMLAGLEGFDERLIKRQDYDLFARALLRGYKPVACPAPIYAYRDHESETRVSRRLTRESFASQLAMFERQRDLLVEVSPRTDFENLRDGLAMTIWVTARNCLRAGFESEAREMFRLSSSLDSKNNISGKLPYRLLVTLLGPMAAESLLDRAKGLRG